MGLPLGEKYYLVGQEEVCSTDEFNQFTTILGKSLKVFPVKEVLGGQACSANLAISSTSQEPIVIGTCDSVLQYDEEVLKQTLKKDFDIIAITVKDYPVDNSSKESFDWLEVSNGDELQTSV